jgi:hypothetical protein
MLPVGVESKVEQYFQKNRSAPARRSQSSAARASATAVAAGAVRHFKAMTSKAAVSVEGALGPPIRRTLA